MYQDKTLTCRNCGKEFIFSAGEQEFYAEKGFENEPVRCRECRQLKRNSTRNQKPEVFEIVCSKCGKVDTVPFEPRHDRPVYCNGADFLCKNITNLRIKKRMRLSH